MNLNITYLSGRLTRDVELRTTQTGTAIAKTAIAHNNRYKDKQGQWQDGPPLFLDLVAWAHVANSMHKHCQKGDLLMVVGRLNLEQWEAKDGGGKRSRHTLTVQEYSLLPVPNKQERGDDVEQEQEEIQY